MHQKATRCDLTRPRSMYSVSVSNSISFIRDWRSLSLSASFSLHQHLTLFAQYILYYIYSSIPTLSLFFGPPSPSLTPTQAGSPGVCRSRENKAAMAACGEKRDGVLISVSDSVVCPKPRRIGILNPSLNEQSRPSRWHANYQTEISDSKAGMELLDIILIKGSYNVEKSITQVASSPPFFSGSPPSRASNPLIQDSQFRNKEFSPLSPLSYQAPNLVSSPSSSARKGGSCARVKFGQKPAAVRVEGFDCISRDRRSISAVA